ncbi:MAG: hypothetical protein HAW67_06105 [Endozoicomonadaceae bacterium]|nr:hypothetical protein [Endozoicomonadaceae bacterium]
MANIVLTEKQKLKITKAVKALNQVRNELQSTNPDNDINWYLEDCGNLHLMEDLSHDEKGNARQDRVIFHISLIQSSGGGW